MCLVFSYDGAVIFIVGEPMQDNKWIEYEKFKKEIAKLGLTPEEYERAIKEFVKALGL
jgi:hypothetical protein